MRLEILEPRCLLSNGAGALAAYVAGVYHDLLGRDVDPDSQVYWVGRLQQGESIGDMAGAIVESREFQANAIDAAYETILGRAPDQGGLDYWLNKTDDQAEIGLLASDEFYARAGGDNQAFLQAAYQILLGRPADQAGLQHWLGELDDGQSPSDVVAGLMHSQEGRAWSANDDYLQVFHRPGDETGLAYWTARLGAGTTNDEVLREFVANGDYFKLQARQPITTVPVKSAYSWWQPFSDQLAQQAQQGSTDLLFVGDSITAGWGVPGWGEDAWQEYFAPRNAMNSSIAGDTTQTLLWRLQNGDLGNLQPKLVVLMIGTNNVTERDSPADINAGIRAVIDLLRSELPASKILVMGLLPRGGSSDDPLRQEVVATNALLESVADDQAVFYQDVSASFLSADGYFVPGVIQPGFTHPTAQGYQILAAAIEPTVETIVGQLGARSIGAVNQRNS